MLKNSLSYIGFIIFSLIFISGCGSSKKAFKSPQDFSLTIQRTACFGTCPIFVMTVNNKGEVDYQGERFVKNVGHFRKSLDQTKFKSIVEQMQKSNIHDMKDDYNNEGISDLPSVILTYTAEGKTKKVLCRYQCPAEFTALVLNIEALIGDDGFTKMETPKN